MPRCTPARFQSAENTRRSFETRSLDLFRIFQQATDYHHRQLTYRRRTVLATWREREKEKARDGSRSWIDKEDEQRR